MEVVAGAASAVAILQVTAEISKLCGKYVREVRHAQKDIERLQSKVSALHGMLTRLHNEPRANIDAGVIEKCCEDLSAIKDKLEPRKKDFAMSRIGFKSLKWPFTSKEVEDQVQALEQYLLLFNTSLQLNIHDDITDAAQDRLLEKLAYVGDALFNSYENDQRHQTCLEGTRVDILRDIQNWSADRSSQRIFWLKGLAGMGKSTIATTVASQFRAKSVPLATYFFKRGHSDLAHIRKLIPTLVRQFSRYSTSYRQFVLDVIKDEPDVGLSTNLEKQYDLLLIRPFRKFVASNAQQFLFSIIIDALDECEEQNGLRMLLRLLANTADVPSLGLKIFVTSRPELIIRHGFENMPSIFHRDMALQDVPRTVVDADIRAYLEHEMEEVRHEFRISADWPKQEDLSTLCQKAGGLFIFAATACRYVGGSSHANPQKRLKEICSSATTNNLMTHELDHMYTMVLRNSIVGALTEEERNGARASFHYIIGCIVLLLDPLTMNELFSLLNRSYVESPGDLDDVLRMLHAVIHVPDDANSPVQPLHLSFRDYLLDPTRCSDHHFLVDEKEVHQHLALDCLCLLSSTLSRNMCGLPSLGTLMSDVDPQTIENVFPPAVQYACRHWVEHVRNSSMVVDDHGCIHDFLQTHFLHWIEGMALMGKISEAIVALSHLAALTRERHCFAHPLAREFVYDCHRFVMAFKAIIEESPAQVYTSALLFSPVQSILRKKYEHEIPHWMKLGLGKDERWNRCLLSITRTVSVKRLRFLPGTELLASFANFERSGQRIELWDVQTGDCRSELKNSPQQTHWEKLSPDGLLIASLTTSGTLDLWDMTKQKSALTITSDCSKITTADISSSGCSLAIGSGNGSVWLAEVLTGRKYRSLDAEPAKVRDLTFSPDGKLLAGAVGGRVRLWDVERGSQRFIPHDRCSQSPKFSPDSTLLAIPQGFSVMIWDVAKSRCWLEPKFGSSDHPVTYFHDVPDRVNFSPDSKFLALLTSGSFYDRTVETWDMQTGGLRFTLEASCVAFSPNGQLLATGTHKGFIRLWDVQSWECVCTLDGYTNNDAVSAVCFSPDQRLLASTPQFGTLRLHEIDMMNLSPTSEPESQKVDGRALQIHFLRNGDCVVVIFQDSVQLFDWDTGNCKFEHWGRCISLSTDGSMVALVFEGMVRFVEIFTGYTYHCVEEQLLTRYLNTTLMVLSSDCQLAAFVIQKRTIWLWHIRERKRLFTFQGHTDPGPIARLVFSPSGGLLVSVCVFDKSVRIWGNDTGKCVAHFLLKGGGVPREIKLSPDDRLLASISHHRLRVWGTVSGNSRFRFNPGRKFWFGKIAFSPDSKRLAVTVQIESQYIDNVWLLDVETGSRILEVAPRPGFTKIESVEFVEGINAIFVNGIAHRMGPTDLTRSQIEGQYSHISHLQIGYSEPWITKLGERVLHLPRDRRPWRYKVWGNRIAIKSEVGRLTCVAFDEDPDAVGAKDKNIERILAQE
ncbi:MAG: hypothetical protein Q9219_005791 [cf. Caloplaca sp. 3 TL-2023]